LDAKRFFLHKLNFEMKKPLLLKILPPIDASFVLKGDNIAWNNPWHYHPELELIFCISGKGTNFVGNAIKSIEEGEILLFGSNLPHTRQRDKAYYEANSDKSPESIILQFREDFLGERFFQIPEFLPIKDMMQRALRGLKFYGNTIRVVSEKLYAMKNLDPAQSILALLGILDILSKSEEYEYLNSPEYVNTTQEKYGQRLNVVYEYTITNFRKPVELAQVAQLTNLSISAFCRYFKKITRKSYFEYLTEVRIGFACKLLSEGNLDIGQIALESGFNNLSNFNKLFKKTVNLTPKQYQKESVKIA
jgi:AraC-like DNA-binding protein